MLKVQHLGEQARLVEVRVLQGCRGGLHRTLQGLKIGLGMILRMVEDGLPLPDQHNEPGTIQHGYQLSKCLVEGLERSRRDILGWHWTPQQGACCIPGGDEGCEAGRRILRGVGGSWAVGAPGDAQ